MKEISYVNTMGQLRVECLDFVGTELEWLAFRATAEEYNVYISKHPIGMQSRTEGDILFKARGSRTALAVWAKMEYGQDDGLEWVDYFCTKYMIA